MGNYRRWRQHGAWVFFTVVTYNRQPLFGEPLARDCLRQAMIDTQKSHPFEIFAISLLPDHLHCVWVLPPNDSDYSTRWRLIKAKTTHALLAGGKTFALECASRRRRGEKTVWQRRYWEKILTNETELKNYVDYLHYNPVKHGLVKHLNQWPHSSFQRFVEQGEYSKDWGSELPGNLKDWENPELE